MGLVVAGIVAIFTGPPELSEETYSGYMNCFGQQILSLRS